MIRDMIARWAARWVTTPKGRAFVADVDWHRSEELRPDRLGPDSDEVLSWIKRDPDRPKNSLG